MTSSACPHSAYFLAIVDVMRASFLNSSSPYGRDSAAGSRGFLAPRPGPPDMATKMALMLTCRRCVPDPRTPSYFLSPNIRSEAGYRRFSRRVSVLGGRYCP